MAAEFYDVGPNRGNPTIDSTSPYPGLRPDTGWARGRGRHEPLQSTVGGLVERELTRLMADRHDQPRGRIPRPSAPGARRAVR